MAKRQKVTIKDVADTAGVSIATVSHVINCTRYVKPELVQRVQEAIVATGYQNKRTGADGSLSYGRSGAVALLVPNLEEQTYVRIASHIHTLAEDSTLRLSVHITNDDKQVERQILQSLISKKTYAAILLVPATDNPRFYGKLLRSRIPFVCIERKINSDEICSVTFAIKKAIYLGTKQLIKNRHERIALLKIQGPGATGKDQLEGYQQALEESSLYYRGSLVFEFEPHMNGEAYEHEIKLAYERQQPSACVVVGNELTCDLLKTLQNMGKECPRDVSIIAYGDNPFYEITAPPLTILKEDTEQMAQRAWDALLRLMAGEQLESRDLQVGVELINRKSTRMLGMGPFGEKAVSPDEIILTTEERRMLRDKNYRVAISFHYGGTAWTRLHEQAIRATLESFGISVVSVMDAQFDPSLQLAQLEAIRIQRPDVLIAIPTDDHVTAQKFKELSKSIKLVFISNVPEGLSKESYVTCVSVNERENGNNTGILLGDYFKARSSAKVGFIIHGTPFYGTHLRDASAEKVVREMYAHIDIVAIQSFGRIEHAYDTCKQMIKQHPDIEGLYISWDQPALYAIKALEEMGRTDIAIFTFDLDYKIASYMAQKKMVMGLSTQRPYEQGEATAKAVAKALVSNETFKFVGVQPYVVKPKQLIKAWKDILHETIPSDLERLVKQTVMN